MRKLTLLALIAGGVCFVAYLVTVVQGNMVYEKYSIDAPYSQTPLEAGLIVSAVIFVLLGALLAAVQWIATRRER